jgi:hypothetical protein
LYLIKISRISIKNIIEKIYITLKYKYKMQKTFI